jgi:AcrR family transcriptional regulator
MTAVQRRSQLLELAAAQFAEAGLHGASTEEIARRAAITQAYIFRIFGTKKALFLEVVDQAFDRLIEGMAHASAPAAADSDDPSGAASRRAALIGMGSFYDSALSDRTGLLVQLQAFAACGDAEVRDRVRHHLARMWDVVSERSGLPPVAVKTFLAFGMLLNTAAALQAGEVDADWANGIRTRIHAGLFDQLTEQNNQ